MAAPDPHGSNTLGSTTTLHRTTPPEGRRRSNWGFAITMLGIIAGLALLAWGLNQDTAKVSCIAPRGQSRVPETARSMSDPTPFRSDPAPFRTVRQIDLAFSDQRPIRHLDDPLQKDLSAVARVSDTLFVACDETASIERLTRPYLLGRLL